MILVLYAINLFLITAVAWWLWKFSDIGLRKFYIPGLLVRLVAGIALGLVYTFYYPTGDTYELFNDAASLASTAYQHPGDYIQFLLNEQMDLLSIESIQPRTRFFVYFLSLINVITGSNYWISSLWLSLFSFACSWFLVTELVKTWQRLKGAIVTSFLFVPSVVFWSSGILKEGMAFGALCLIAASFITVISAREMTWRRWIMVAVSVYVLVSLKYYWAAVLLPSILTGLIFYWILESRVKTVGWIALAWLSIFALLCLVVTQMHPNFYPDRFLSIIYENYESYRMRSSDAEVIHYYKFSDSWASVLINSPWALFSCLFRPILFETSSVAGILSSIENSCLLLLFGAACVSRNRSVGNKALVFTVCAYVVTSAIFLALSSPNFGTLSRFRIGFLPFFVLIILADNRLTNHFTKQKASSN